MGGAVGAGLVLVFLPGAALFFGIEWINRFPGAGLPIMAIFGIMILFGALSLTSTLFARLNLSNREEALALPTGSIRAAIAMSLIVLFAIISIMLYQSLLTSNWVTGLSAADKELVLKEPKNQVTAVLPAACAASAAVPPCYSVQLARAAGQEATDLAKQLLVLIGTLMTSLTSYYFAARTASPPKEGAPPDAKAAAPAAAAGPPGGGDTAADTEGHQDGCDVPIAEATTDEELPAAKGGVV
jgi:hypothetical protein